MSRLLVGDVTGSRLAGLSRRPPRAVVGAAPDRPVRACASVAKHPSSVALAEVLIRPARPSG